MKKEKAVIISDERKTRDLMSVSSALRAFSKAVLGRKGFVETDIITGWNNIVGTELAECSQPDRIEFKRGEKNNGILVVNVPSGAFALELQHRENFILSKVNSYFGYNAVSKLKIIQNGAFKLKDEEPVQRAEKTLVSPEEENYIRTLSREVENEALQEVLEKLGRMVISSNKGEKK